MTLFGRSLEAARHPAGIDMSPSAGALAIVTLDAMISILHRTGTAMQRAVLAYCLRSLSKSVKDRIGVVFSFCDLLSTELSFLSPGFKRWEGVSGRRPNVVQRYGQLVAR